MMSLIIALTTLITLITLIILGTRDWSRNGGVGTGAGSTQINDLVLELTADNGEDIMDKNRMTKKWDQKKRRYVGVEVKSQKW